MPKKPHTPRVESWYKIATGERFEVVAVDDDAIEIQYLDGSVEELDRDAWDMLTPREIDPPHEDLLGEDEAESRRPRYRADTRDIRDRDDWPDVLDDEV